MNIRIRDKIFLILMMLGLVFVLVSRLTGLHKNSLVLPKLTIGQVEVQVEVVDNSLDMAKGLSQREKMEENQGMLFFHTAPGRPAYVMREMKFPLDFVFINEKKVVDFAENVPADYSGRIQGATDYQQVLEVNAGWIAKNGIQIGDEVNIP